jgi:hypothetical protein
MDIYPDWGILGEMRTASRDNTHLRHAAFLYMRTAAVLYTAVFSLVEVDMVSFFDSLDCNES